MNFLYLYYLCNCNCNYCNNGSLTHRIILHICVNVGNSPHSSYAMFAQGEYPPNGYPGYNPAYHYSTNPYINPTSSNGYPLAVAGDYNHPNTFGMPPPQHLPQDIKISKDR